MFKKAIDIQKGDHILGSVVSECKTNIPKTIVFLQLEDGQYKVFYHKQEIQIDSKGE